MSYPCLHIELDESDADQASALLYAAGATGIEVRDDSTMVATAAGQCEIIGWFESRDAAEAARQRLEAAPPATLRRTVIEDVDDPGWREAWREFFKPMRFGQRIWVTPPDEDPPREALDGAAAKSIIIRLLPSVAFGTGTHETTALMLELIDELIQPGMRVLDVGCGSGILAMAAAKLGATVALGVDIDGEAVIAAQKNALKNGVADRCRFDGTPLDELPGRYDLVFANLSAPVLIKEKAALVRHVADGGRLLWSGLLHTDLDEVGAPPRCGLEKDLRRGEWVAQSWQLVMPNQ